MNKERFLNTGLLEQYALGLTSPEESLVVEKHLDAFPELKVQLNEMQGALESYARQYSVPPPTGTKENILQQIDQLEQQIPVSKAKSSNRSINWNRLVSYTALLLLTSAYLFQTYRVKQSNLEVRDSKMALLDCKKENASLQQAELIYAFINDPNTLPVVLKGTVLSPRSQALVYWNEESQNAYFFASKLPEVPEGHQYQLWADVDGEMISISLLDNSSSELQQISYIAEATSLNITLEPLGGSEHPNVENLFVNAPLEKS